MMPASHKLQVLLCHASQDNRLSAIFIAASAPSCGLNPGWMKKDCCPVRIGSGDRDGCRGQRCSDRLQQSHSDIDERRISSTPSPANKGVDIGWSLALILYFSLVGLDAFIASNDMVEYLIAICAFLAAAAMLIRMLIPATGWFKVLLIIYLLVYGMGYRLENLLSFAPYIAGLAALAVGGIWAAFTSSPKKQVFYSSIFIALFLLLVGIYQVASNIQCMPVMAMADTLLLITGVVTSVLIWRDLS